LRASIRLLSGKSPNHLPRLAVVSFLRRMPDVMKAAPAQQKFPHLGVNGS
jgi:hypothetical protein